MLNNRAVITHSGVPKHHAASQMNLQEPISMLQLYPLEERQLIKRTSQCHLDPLFVSGSMQLETGNHGDVIEILIVNLFYMVRERYIEL